MLKYIRSLDWGALVGSALVLAFLLGLTIPLADQPKYECAKVNEHHECSPHSGSGLSGVMGLIDTYRDDINALSTAAIALLTIALVVVGFVQSRKLQRTIETMDDTAERQLRAYVRFGMVVDTKTEIRIDAGAPDATYIKKEDIWIEVNFENAGQTPALDVMHACSLDILPYPDPVPFPKPVYDETKSRFVLHPNLRAPWITPVKSDRDFSRTEFEQIKLGKDRRLYLFGEVRYRDVFGKTHYTRFQNAERRKSRCLGR